MTAETRAGRQPDSAWPPARAECVVILVLVAAAFLLRVWQLTAIRLDHFDEGVYAFSALGLFDSSQPFRVYPGQILFSPPVFFSSAGLLSWLAGLATDQAALLLNALLGTATVAAAWWIGRRWFGPGAGVAAAVLLAFSEYHIMLSRTALTDVTFALAFLAAVGALARAVTRPGVVAAVVAGLAVGIAWNTKYHGWFALLAAGAAFVPYAWIRYRRNQAVWPALRALVIAAAVAGLCYLPWALYVESQPGGYRALMAYQRTLVTGDWWSNFWRQVQHQGFLDGPFSRASVPLAGVAALVAVGGAITAGRRVALVLIALLGAAWLTGGNGSLVLLAALAIPVLLARPASYEAWLLLAWLGLWTTSAPLYTPYARLLLPFTVAAALASGALLSTVAWRLTDRSRPARWAPVAIGLAAALAIGLVTGSRGDGGNPWRLSRGVPDAVDGIAALVPEGSRIVVIGEPSLAYYLHRTGRPAFSRFDSPAELAEITEPVYVVTGVYTRRMRSSQEALAGFGDRLSRLGTFPLDPRDIRLQDDFRPADARAYRRSPDDTFAFELYHLVPAVPER